MKNIIVKTSFLIIAVFALVFSGCDKEEVAGTPTISYIRGTDTINEISYANLGQTVAIIGNNLATTKSVSFNGRPANFRTTMLTNTSIVVEVSKQTPFLGDSATSVVEVITDGGTVTATLEIAPPAPEITKSAPMYAGAGADVDIIGDYFYNVTNVKIGDMDVEIIKITPSVISIKVPTGYSKGKISVTSSKSGTGMSKFDFGLDAGVIQLNWGDTWPAGGGYMKDGFWFEGPDDEFADIGTTYRYLEGTYGDTWWDLDGGISFDSNSYRKGEPSVMAFQFEYALIGTVYRITLRFEGVDGKFYEHHEMNFPSTGGKWATYTAKISNFKVDGNGAEISKQIFESGDPMTFKWAFVNQTGGEVTTKCAMTNYRFVKL